MSNRASNWRFLVGVGVVLGCASGALGDDCPSGSDGTDGALDCTALECPEGCDELNPCTVEVDLSLAASLCDCDGGGMLDDPCRWDCPSPVADQGVYDNEQWAVVYKYTTIDIPVGVTVTFKNHPSGAPVIWLASGDVTINGTVNVSGKPGAPSNAPMSFAEPGPGGFAGGVSLNQAPAQEQSAGFGPGGAPWLPTVVGGAYGCIGNGNNSTYGGQGILPLIGGSGAATDSPDGPGAGAGAGAITIASPGQITLEGSIKAIGGGGSAGGSGGAIRLIANSVSGSGTLVAYSAHPTGGCGRIRVDAPVIELTDLGDPNWTTDFACWPPLPPSYAPTLKATIVGGQPVPSDPLAGILTTEAQIEDLNLVEVLIEATNIPAGTSVVVRVVPARGPDFTVPSTGLVDPDMDGILTASAMVAFPPGKSEIQLRANWTP